MATSSTRRPVQAAEQPRVSWRAVHKGTSYPVTPSLIERTLGQVHADHNGQPPQAGCLGARRRPQPSKGTTVWPGRRRNVPDSHRKERRLYRYYIIQRVHHGNVCLPSAQVPPPRATIVIEQIRSLRYVTRIVVQNGARPKTERASRKSRRPLSFIEPLGPSFAAVPPASATLLVRTD